MQALAEAGPHSLFTPVGYQSGSCGYCKDPNTHRRRENTSASYYAYARQLTVEHYQQLVDRAWRRSGTLVYKPDVRRQCCPHYTIRLPVADFHASKDQRGAINRWNKFVLGDQYIKDVARLHPKTRDEKVRQRAGFNLVQTVHESEYEHLKTPPEPAHRYAVALEPDTFTEEKYALFENYQTHVHHEGPSDISRRGFTRFLCNSPLGRTSRTLDSGVVQKLGSFHQCYRLDGRLIAMAVLDLLPQCVSGVYFIYHSDFEKWSFGKISALNEAALALESHHQYYYMGYYIHSCKKMRYKGGYKPQHVLDLETGAWDPMDDEMMRLMDEKKYVSMSKVRAAAQLEKDSKPEHTDDADGSDDSSLSDPLEAQEAYESGRSLFDLRIAGVMKLEETVEQVDLDQVKVLLKGGTVTYMANIVAWEAGSETNPLSLKGIVAELSACVGPGVANEMIVALGPQ